MKSIVGSFSIGPNSFPVRGLPGTPQGITGLRLANQSPVTLSIAWGEIVLYLYPATVDIFPTPRNPTSDIIVTPINVFPAGFAPSGSLLVEAAYAPDEWKGQYPLLLPPGASAVGAIAGTIPSGGQLATYQLAQQLTPQYSVAPNSSVTKTVTIQPGMQVISLFLWGPLFGTCKISVNGNVSGFKYFGSTRTFTGGVNIVNHVLAEPAAETLIDIIVDASGAPVPGSPVNVKIVGGPNPVEQVDTNIHDSLGASILADSAGNLQVTQQSGQAAPWQMANQPPAVGSANLVAGGSLTIIVGISSRPITLLGGTFFWNANAPTYVDFGDDTGVLYHRSQANGGTPYPAPWQGAPVTIPALRSFRVINTSGVGMGTVYVNWSILFNQ